MFGLRPALRGLATRGPYGLVRHPLYLAYVISDIGYYLDEWNFGIVLIGAFGWASLAYRIVAEERVLSRHAQWRTYVNSVPYRLLPGVW
jgi:protein-S-isoprenylcysteine O-methyltransferase Ste14